MSKAIHLKGKWILVTGASAGLGQAMARELAYKYKANLFILARRKQQLEDLRQELETKAGVQVKIVLADLSKLAEVDAALENILSTQELSGAILNAGITYFGEHAEITWEKFEALMQINLVSVVRMTGKLISYFEKENKDAALMIVSSMAGMIPVPYKAVYSGTKAFLINYGSALSHELKSEKISITIFAPGGMVTEMTGGEDFKPLKKWLMPVDQAAREGIQAFQARKSIHVPGFSNRLSVFFFHLLPKKFITAKVAEVYRRALNKP